MLQLTENDIRKVKNDIVTLGQKAIDSLEHGAESQAWELMKQQRDLKDLLERYELEEKIKSMSLEELIDGVRW